MPQGTLDVEEGAEEAFALGGDYEITVTCRRPEGSKSEIIAAAGSMAISEEMRTILVSREVAGIVPNSKALAPFAGVVEGLTKELNNELRRTLALARWRVGASGPHDPLRATSRHEWSWSFDGEHWHPFPLWHPGLEIRVDAPILVWRPDVKQSLAELLRAGVTEPTAYNLLLEAFEQRTSNPRSSLVIGVAALEIGVKQCIADLAPSTEWLLAKLQSPPVVSLLCDYLPTLEVKVKIRGGRTLPPPKAIRRAIHGAVETRNSLVHRSGDAMKDFDLEEALKAIRDVLFLLEFYQGNDWAWARMRYETHASMLAEAKIPPGG